MASRFSAVATPNDTRLNLRILLQWKRCYIDDIGRILSRFKHFRHEISPVTKGWGGYVLNMREFIRAMEMGTRKTIRVRNVGTQTDSTEFDDTFFDSNDEVIPPTPESQRLPFNK